MSSFEVIVIGAGAAGMMCAALAAKRGRNVLLLEHNAKAGAKILISGGGRCNFTNAQTTSAQFVSQNKHFCKSALTRYTADDFLALVKEYNIAFHEKKLGQLFCDNSAKEIAQMLEEECQRGGVEIKFLAQIDAVEKTNEAFEVRVKGQTLPYTAKSLVVATGGLSIPKIGASPFGYKIAQQFGLAIVPTRAALDGFVLTDHASQVFKDLSGLSVDCVLSINGESFRENILFTHRGLSGPAALQGSLHWELGQELSINLTPGHNIAEVFLQKKKEQSLAQVKTLLTNFLPARLVDAFCAEYFSVHSQTPICQIADKALNAFAAQLSDWRIKPAGTVGYSKAEVTRGGVSTDELSSKTMEAKKVSGLYFIGEVVDVTGWLGGYNFQWAWSSAWAAAQSV